MVKVEGLVNKDNEARVGTLKAYADALDLDLEMPAEAVSDEPSYHHQWVQLKVLVDNAEVILDAVVGLAHKCGFNSADDVGSRSGLGCALGNLPPWSDWAY